MAIADYLCEGKSRGISLKRLSEIIEIPEREVMRRIHKEREAGASILSDTVHGYYLPENEAERAACIKKLRHRAAEIYKAASGMENGPHEEAEAWQREVE